jgi:hypothetical protein
MTFNRPMKLVSLFLKEHRSPNFYLHTSTGMYWMKAYLKDTLVLEIAFQAFNTEWKMYQPYESLIVDRVILAPGLDVDNMVIQIENKNFQSQITI